MRVFEQTLKSRTFWTRTRIADQSFRRHPLEGDGERRQAARKPGKRFLQDTSLSSINQQTAWSDWIKRENRHVSRESLRQDQRERSRHAQESSS
ncbi:MAG TPA: hypothetical protein VMT20_14085 [Terriglobia bacterium]|nr:hypothetical protein [Terriglobia bacterium]